jgi:hypothetical protein
MKPAKADGMAPGERLDLETNQHFVMLFLKA